MKNNEKLKKHHFWILAGLAPFLTLLAIIMILSEVGGAIEETAKKTDEDLKKASGTQTKGTKAIEDFKKQKEELEKRKVELWKVNYEKQKDQFTWPGRNQYLKQLEEKFPTFGEPMKADRDEFNTFKSPEIYEAAYDEAANSIKPTTFPTGNWRTGGPVFRYVSAWGDRVPTDRQIWLALEDLWVQRALLQPVIAINEGATKFIELPQPAGTKPNPLKKTFANRLWRLDLEIPESGPNARKVIESRLTNLTDRLQVLGTGGTMRLRVKLSDLGQPIDYIVQENYVRPNGVVVLKQDLPPDDAARAAAKKKGELSEFRLNPAPNAQGIPTGTDVQKIVSVTQVLDERTVPVRQVLNVELGYKDCRHAAAPLKAHDKFPAPEPAAGSTTSGGGEAAGGRGGGGALGMPGASGGSPDGGTAAQPGAAGGGRRGPKAGSPLAILDANRERYIEVSKQVRRMPVAVVILVDQLFMQDALVAYANSSLRFQVTQSHWKRFRGSLSTTTGGGGDGSFGSPGVPGTGSEDGGAAYNLPAGPMGGGGGAGGGLTLSPRGAPGGGISPGDPGTPPPPMGITAGPPMGVPAGMYPGFGSGFPGSNLSGPISEAQLTSGLIELTIYGIVTLYERYDEKSADGSTPTPSTPAPKETTPAPMTTSGTPMTTTPTPKETTPTPKAETPKAETPKTETPKTEAPKNTTPAPKDGVPGTPKM